MIPPPLSGLTFSLILMAITGIAGAALIARARKRRSAQTTTVYLTLFLSYVLTGAFFFAAYYLLDPFFRLPETGAAQPPASEVAGEPAGEGENPLVQIALSAYAFVRSTPAIFYFFLLFTILVFLNEIPYILLALLHRSALSWRRASARESWYRPLVSLIVPAHNEEKVIANTLDSLLETDYPEKEIIVTDDGSTDSTGDIISSYAGKNVIVVRRPQGGKAAAINTALAYANGEIIVVVDADSVVRRDSVSKIVENFVDERVVAVAGNVKVGNRRGIFTKLQSLEYVREINLRRSAFDLLNTIYVVPGALGAFRRRSLEESGNYDSDTITEDMDLTLKMLKTGGRITYERDSVSYTEAPQTIKGWIKQRRRWYGGTLQTIFKHRKGWWRQGALGVIGFPYLVLSSLLVPVVEISALIVGTVFAILGFWLGIALAFLLSIVLELFASIVSIRIDGEDQKLALYTPLFVIGYRYLIDLVRLMTFSDFVRGSLSWRRSGRHGNLAEKVEIRY